MKQKTTPLATVPHVAQEVRHLLTTSATQAGIESGFVKRESKLNGATFVETLVLGWMAQPEARLEELAQMAANVGVVISAQALDQRFGPAGAECLRQVLSAGVRQQMQASEAMSSLLSRFNGVYLRDSTVISLPDELKGEWPGCGGDKRTTHAALKIQLQYELTRGEITDLVLSDGKSSDRTAESQHTPLPAGALRLADLGYFSLAVLAEQPEVYFLTRPQSSVIVFDAADQPVHLDGLLRQCPTDEVEMTVRVGRTHQLPCRLLARRAPPDVAQLRRRRLKERARKSGRTVSQATRALADWSIFITNVPATLLTLAEVFTVARCRWQIELIFKLWKSHGHLDEWRSTKPWRILCEIYAKLIALLIQHWLCLTSHWHKLDRSLLKAAHTLQTYVILLATTLSSLSQFRKACERIQLCLSTGCHLNRSAKSPRTFQLLELLA
jgi:hypothetical protein